MSQLQDVRNTKEKPHIEEVRTDLASKKMCRKLYHYS